MLKQAQKMQEDMASLQAELEQTEYTAVSGGGAVSATVDGSHKLKNLTISPDVVDGEDVEFLAAMITAAINEAIEKAQNDSSEKMGAITGGMNLPGMF